MTASVVRLCMVILAVAVLALPAAAANPKSIFDDDWMPPKPVAANPVVKPPPPAPTPKPTPTPEPPTPDASAKPPTPVVVVVAPAARLAIPARDAQIATRKILREVFAEQLADVSAPARRKLAQKLLAQAEQSGDAPVDRFVLLAAAVDAGVEAGSLALAFKAADALGAAFDVDPLAVKAEKVSKFKAVPSADPAAENLTAAIDVSNRLCAADDHAAATRVLQTIQPLAANDPKLRTQVLAALRDVGLAKQARDQVARHIETLKATPDDPAANLAVGSYLCFNKGDWIAGLAMLTRGGDAKLKGLAEKDLLNPSVADEQAVVGDGWWDVAATASPLQRGTIQIRAAQWYEKALPGLKGLNKAKVEKRLSSIASLIPKAEVAATTAGATTGSTTAGPGTGATSGPKPGATTGAKPGVTTGAGPSVGTNTSKDARVAEVEVDATWAPLKDGSMVHQSDRTNVVNKVPEVLAGRSFALLNGKAPKLNFKVTKDGVLWLACTDRWGGGGNAGGNWKPECISRADLEKQGWREVSNFPVEGQSYKWIVFVRQCRAGEEFSYRTEKYNTPFLLR